MKEALIPALQRYFPESKLSEVTEPKQATPSEPVARSVKRPVQFNSIFAGGSLIVILLGLLWAWPNVFYLSTGVLSSTRTPMPTFTSLSTVPMIAEDWNRTGVAKFNKEDYQGALVDYTKAIELDPNFVIAYYNRGRAYYDLVSYDLAIADYFKAIALDPNFAPAYHSRGFAYQQKGDKQIAIEDLKKAAELYQQQGKTVEQQEVLEQIKQLQQ